MHREVKADQTGAANRVWRKLFHGQIGAGDNVAVGA
jgi:hypothetical protein